MGLIDRFRKGADTAENAIDELAGDHTPQ